MDVEDRETSDDGERLGACMAAAQAGDAAAYDELLHELAARARRLVRVLMRDARDVEDVVQEILLAVHKARHTFDPARPFLPWFHAIARHRAADMRRWRSRRDRVETANEIALMMEPAPDAGDPGELTEELRAALDALPERQRDIVRKLKIEGRSVKEIADEMGLSESNVKVLAHRAYGRMREHLRSGDANG